MYTEASYSLSQLISFCNSVVLDNVDAIGTSTNNQSTVVSSSVRSLDYYLWVVTRVITHLEVLLEKAAGAFWGDNSKERSILVSHVLSPTSQS